MKKHILAYSFFVILLSSSLFAEEDWRQLLLKAEEKMNTETMSYLHSMAVNRESRLLELHLQQKNPDGTTSHLEEILDNDGTRKNRETMDSYTAILRTYYSADGRTSMLIHRDRSVGMQCPMKFKLALYSQACQETTGKEIVYRDTPCWEITQTMELPKHKISFRTTIAKDTCLVLKKDTVLNGTLRTREEYSDFDFSPQFAEDTFVIPKDAKIQKVKDLEKASAIWKDIILKDAHETVKRIKTEVHPKPPRFTTAWRKVKRNPSPYIVGMAVALAGISFGTAAILKRREKKRK